MIKQVVVPYYLSQGYNVNRRNGNSNQVVVPYYLSQGYNIIELVDSVVEVVVPYYLSQGYNIPVPSNVYSMSCSSLLSLSRV